MGGSSSGGSQTTRLEPPKYQLPYLERGLGYAQNQFNTGGTPVVPFAGETERGLTGITDMATAGNPITGNANNLASQTLSGGFLGSNPYLDQTFNQAALATQNQLASQFAGSGRNIEASQGLRSQQLNDLATNIYGGAYDAERNRQNQVLGMSPQLGQAAYTDFDRLIGVGGAREGLAQEYASAPGRNLDEFLGRVSGNMGQTSTTPQYRNRAAGAIGGGMFGAQLGNQLGNGNPWATGIGGLLGAFGGGWG